jgi:hypothetical protein
VDQEIVGTFQVDVSSPSDTIEFSVEEGSHDYVLSGVFATQDGATHPIRGEGTFSTLSGRSFEVSYTSSDKLQLRPTS